jgi:two-component system phosphate regulon sensor histidine kinase PhoR
VTLILTLVSAVALCVAAWFALTYWRHLLEVRRAVSRLASKGSLGTTLSRSGTVRAIFADLRQIESRQREITRLVEDEDFSLRVILSSMAEGVLVVNRDFTIRLANQRLLEMFSLPRMPVGRSIMEVFRNHMLQRLAQRTADRQDAQFGELQVNLKDNSEFVTKHFQVTSVELRPPGKESTRGILMVFHDITQIRSLEAFRRDFVANVYHELRTPLAIISGYLETLLDPEHEADETTRARFLNIVQRHAGRLNLLVEDLLELSRLESGRLPLRLEPVDVRSCVEQVLERLDERVRDSHTEIKIAIPPDLPPLEADALRFEQIIFNVLDNALKYGAKDQPRVAISAEPRPQELALTISDNGPGIPATDQPHIFERFYRVHKDRSRHGGGTGLGLSIVKHSMQAHGGSVNLTSEPGAGTTFVLRFPWKRTNAKGELAG